MEDNRETVPSILSKVTFFNGDKVLMVIVPILFVLSALVVYSSVAKMGYAHMGTETNAIFTKHLVVIILAAATLMGCYFSSSTRPRHMYMASAGCLPLAYISSALQMEAQLAGMTSASLFSRQSFLKLQQYFSLPAPLMMHNQQSATSAYCPHSTRGSGQRRGVRNNLTYSGTAHARLLCPCYHLLP